MWTSGDGQRVELEDVLEGLIIGLLQRIDQLPVKDYGSLLETLMDKYLILAGFPTERTESGGNLLGLSGGELDAVLREAERILQRGE